ncbi:general odorant-binding protein 99b-like [Armigeres subalbatus]|uniref:general odorant-binding protein 99b-like n=1 Tax=Armigeres subalbatus TaxID=124917 RepID=UPI002ED57054
MKIFVATLLLIGFLFHHCSAVVYGEDDYRGFRQKCSKILQTPKDTVQKAEQKSFQTDSDDMHCLIRCVGILSGFYDDETGTNWDLVRQQLDGQEGFEEHRQATTACTEALPAEELASGVCRKSYLFFRCAMKSAKEHIRTKS